MNRSIAIVLATTLVSGVANAQDISASAEMSGIKGESLGTVSLQQTVSGMVHLVVDMKNLPDGVHGFHIHEKGACDVTDGFKSAGGHFAGDKDHGVMSKNGPHPGDLPNVTVGESGILKAEFFTDRLSLGKDGASLLLDKDGSAVVMHSGADDYKSQPSGDAGDRIACGVIE